MLVRDAGFVVGMSTEEGQQSSSAPLGRWCRVSRGAAAAIHRCRHDHSSTGCVSACGGGMAGAAVHPAAIVGRSQRPRSRQRAGVEKHGEFEMFELDNADSSSTHETVSPLLQPTVRFDPRGNLRAKDYFGFCRFGPLGTRQWATTRAMLRTGQLSPLPVAKPEDPNA